MRKGSEGENQNPNSALRKVSVSSNKAEEVGGRPTSGE